MLPRFGGGQSLLMDMPRLIRRLLPLQQRYTLQVFILGMSILQRYIKLQKMVRPFIITQNLRQGPRIVHQALIWDEFLRTVLL